MFRRMVLDFVVVRANAPDVCSKESVSVMSVVANVAVRAGSVL